MKKLLTTALLACGIILACQKEESQNSVTPAQKSTLTPEEEQVSKSTGKVVSFSQIKSMIDAFKAENPNAIHSVAYGKDALEQVLNQKGCVRVRFHFVKEDGKTSIVFVGMDKEGNDIKSSPNARGINDDGNAGSSGIPCPKQCPPWNE